MPTARFGITLLSEAQAQKSLSVNNALNLLDANAAHLGLANTFTATNTFANLLCNLNACTSYGGNNVPFNFASTLVTFTSDANKTLVVPATTAAYIDIQTDAVLTAQRDLIVQLGIGNFWIVRNRNAQNIRIIGSSGAGIVVGTTKMAILLGSGANVIRVTPDTLTTP
jgi:hypothetical protein